MSGGTAWLRRVTGSAADQALRAADQAFRALEMYPAEELGYPPLEPAHLFWRSSRAGSRVYRLLTVGGDIYAFCLTVGPVSLTVESRAEHEWLTGARRKHGFGEAPGATEKGA